MPALDALWRDMPAEVRAVFDAMPAVPRKTLLAVRDIVLATAADTEGVGPIVETLKWGDPSYLPRRPRVGTTLRLGITGDRRPAIFVHCQTRLIDAFRARYADRFDFEGNRALVIRDGPPADAELTHCVAMALTYHRRKRA